MFCRILNAPPALRRFLDARSIGAPEDELKELSAAATAEATRLNSRARPAGENLRLAVDNDREGDGK